MSMYRQMWLAVIIAMLLALAGSLFASLLSARAYLQEQLSLKNADNATAVALSLSQGQPDPVAVDLVVAALFDSGHYELIRVTDPFGKTVSERQAPEGDAGAPAWFVQKLPLAARAGQAQITSGWKQVGTITLVSHSRFAYRALWDSALKMMLALGIAGLVGGYLGTLVLRRLRPSLEAVIGQANAITERRFVVMPEPDVPEMRALARAMNQTVGRLKAMFDEEAARLEVVRRQANFDGVTGLANREFFVAGVRTALEEESTRAGLAVVIRIGDLAGINRRLGRAAADELLKTFAATLDAQASGFEHEQLCGRLNGADFGLLVRGTVSASRLEQMLRALVEVVGRYSSHEPGVAIGFSEFAPGESFGSLMGRIDEALAAAESSGRSALREAKRDDGDMPRTAQAWEAAIRTALDRRWVRLVTFPVVGRDGAISHVECPLRLMFDERGEWLPAGRFFPIAERLGLTATLDLAAVRLGLEQLATDQALPGLAVNLSPTSLAVAGFSEQLAALAGEHRGVAGRLWLELSEHGVVRHFEAFRAMCALVRPIGCRIGVEHFGAQFSQIGRLQELGLDYVKVDAAFIRGLDRNEHNQVFLAGLCNIARVMGFAVFAEGVASDGELRAVRDLDFDGATGPAIKSPV